MKMLIIIAVFVVLVVGIIVFLRKRLTKNTPEFSEEEYARHYEAKQSALERVLGPMHDMVGHAIIPFQIGGAVDMYYFCKGIPGTACATMELIEPDGSGPKPNQMGTYELVAFTKHEWLEMTEEGIKKTINKIERHLCGILTNTGLYSYEAVLQPGDTCEIPGKEGEPNICLILDEYSPNGVPFEIEGKKHGLLLCLEVFKSEMDYARENGSAIVLQKLKEAGYYPYSDLDRQPVF